MSLPKLPVYENLTQNDFQGLVLRLWEDHVLPKLVEKGQQYAPADSPAFQNFIAQEKSSGIPMQQALVLQAQKHWDVLTRNNSQNVDELRERARDVIIYMTLLYAMTLDKSEVIQLETPPCE